SDGDRLAAETWIVPLLDGRIEGVHVDVDDLALMARGSCLVFIVLDGRVADPAVSSLTPRATIRSDPSGRVFLVPTSSSKKCTRRPLSLPLQWSPDWSYLR